MISIASKIDKLQRQRGTLLKQLCSVANQIKAVDIDIANLRFYEQRQIENKER